MPRNEEDAIGYEFINGEFTWVYDFTPEIEARFYAAGEIGPEGMTICHSDPLPE